MAQWLLTVKPTFINMCVDESAFCVACENGHLHVVQWLHNFNYTHTHISTCNIAFKKACSNGHLHVAQWLLKIKPAIISLTRSLNFFFFFSLTGGEGILSIQGRVTA